MGTTADTDALQRELHSVQATLSRIRQEVLCGVCREAFVAPVVFPCSHTFCSLCARRYMLHNSICPDAHCKKATTTDQLRPVRALELVTRAITLVKNSTSSSDRPREHRYRPFLAPGATRSMLRDKLGAVGLPVDGGTDILHARYREFVLLWNANLDSLQPRSELTIADRVRRAEQEQKDNSNKSKSKGQRAIAFRKLRTPTSLENDNLDAPREGDDFQTLMDKVRRRENRPAPGMRCNSSSDVANTGRSDATSIVNQQVPSIAISELGEATTNAAAIPETNDSEINAQREPSPIHTESATESDLALIQAADHATQSQEVNATGTDGQQRNEHLQDVAPERGESPTESDLLLIEAADQALSQSQEVWQDAHGELPAEDDNSIESIPTQPPSPGVPELPPSPVETHQISNRAQQSCTAPAPTVPETPPRPSANTTPQLAAVPETPPQSVAPRRMTSSPIIPETPPSVAPATGIQQVHRVHNQPRELFAENGQQQQQQIAQPVQTTQPSTQRYGAGHISIGPRRISQYPRPNTSVRDSPAQVNNHIQTGPPTMPLQRTTIDPARGVHSVPAQSLLGNATSTRANNIAMQSFPQTDSSPRNARTNNYQVYRPRQALTPVNAANYAQTPLTTGSTLNNGPRSTPISEVAFAAPYTRRQGVTSAPQVRQPPIASQPYRNGTSGNNNWRQGVSNSTQPSFSQPVAQRPNTQSQITAEQRERIERNRQRAISIQLAKRRRLNEQQQQRQR